MSRRIIKTYHVRRAQVVDKLGLVNYTLLWRAYRRSNTVRLEVPAFRMVLGEISRGVTEGKMAEKQQSRKRPQKKDSMVDVAGETFIRDISFCGVPENGSNASMVDVKDGKIIRIRPMHYDWKYDPKDMNPWKMESRGKTFEPSMKTLLPPY
ncbi:MAG TPA: hypothetical protein VEG43_02720, partial [Dehalococcoidia bacterium]|nr:hypothetical protein [Dehalococcoidia bacterium]